MRDGKFEFTVTGVDCGAKRVGGQYFGEDALGQFCTVALTVTNIGDKEQTLFGSSQYLFDAAGRKFSASTDAALWDATSKSLWEPVNPGNTMTGKIHLDVPVGVSPTRVELHDSMFSGGATVLLG